MKIPFVDLGRQYKSIKDKVERSIRRVLQKSCFILGEEVEKFEEEFATYCGLNYGVGVASGTDALVLSLKALGIGKGDEVITVPNTFTATVDAIIRNGARPVFVDIDEETYNINVNKIKAKITKKTKAIIPVHLYGQSVDLEQILNIAKEYKLFVIEDACQAHGAEYKGRKVGSFGVTGCFSFYPAKNLGAYGDGGMVVSNNKRIAEKIKMLRNYGQRKKYYHDLVGFNSRLDEIQAAILRIKLRYLNDWINQRRRIAQQYYQLLKEIKEIALPKEREDRKHVYHLFVIRTKFRNKLQKYLASREIQTGLHYPKSSHLQKAYRFLGYKRGDFPIAEKCAREILSLPIFPELRNRELRYIQKTIKNFFYRSGKI